MKRIASAILAAGFAIFCSAAWGQVTSVPNTFTSGTQAKAADVNADFAALVSALPGVSMKSFSSPTITIPAGTTSTNLGSMTINAPSYGFALVTLWGNVTTSKGINMGVSNVSAPDVSLDGIPLAVCANTSTFNNFSTQWIFTVTKGSNTFWAITEGYGASASDVSYTCYMFVQFFPNSY